MLYHILCNIKCQNGIQIRDLSVTVLIQHDVHQQICLNLEVRDFFIWMYVTFASPKVIFFSQGTKFLSSIFPEHNVLRLS